MSDESNEAPKTRKRPGRKPGSKRRTDPAPAPIDGDYAPLDVVGKEPGFEYFALSDRDRQRRGHQYEVVRWSENCAHSPWEEFAEDKRGKEVRINGQLTLVRIPSERVEARRRRERGAFNAQSKGIAAGDRAKGFNVNETVMPMDAINVSGLY